MDPLEGISVPVLAGPGKAFPVIRCDKRGFVVFVADHRRRRLTGQLHHRGINRELQAFPAQLPAKKQGQGKKAEYILYPQLIQPQLPHAPVGAVDIQPHLFPPDSRPDGAARQQQAAIPFPRRLPLRQAGGNRRQHRQHRHAGKIQLQCRRLLPYHRRGRQSLPAAQQNRPQQRGQQRRQQQQPETENCQKYFAVAGCQSRKQQQRKGNEKGYAPPCHRIAGTGMVRRMASMMPSGVCRRTAA